MSEIKLTRGYSTIVSEEDYEYLAQFKWFVITGKNNNYAVRQTAPNGKCICHLMHRVIMERMGIDLNGFDVDHINRNSLDNRRENLRRATRSQNLRNKGLQSNNTSGFPGVEFYKTYQKWRASIKVNGRKKHVGYYNTIAEAVASREQAARKEYGEFYPNAASCCRE